MITKDDIVVEALRQLGTFKYFYRSTIVGCIKAIAHQNRIVLTNNEVEDFTIKVADGWNVMFEEESGECEHETI